MLRQKLPDSKPRTSKEDLRIRLYLFQGLGDIAVVLGSFLLAGGLYMGQWPSHFALAMSYAYIPLFVIMSVYQRSYSIPALYDVRYAVGRATLALVTSALLCFVVIFYAQANEKFSRVMFSMALVSSWMGISVIRWITHELIEKYYSGAASNVLIVHDGGPHVEVKGAQYLSTEDLPVHLARYEPESLDVFGRLFRTMDRVIVSCSVERRLDWAEILRAAGVRGEVVSQSLEELGALALERENGWVSVVISTGPLGLRDRFIKRIMDIAITIPALILLSPIMLIAAVAIKLEDGGPIFFVQERMGRSNCLFKMLKFRSMSVGDLDVRGDRSTSRTDSRVTRVGSFIRKTSIDELPQLINVLRSEMSIVGPRPHALGSQAGDKLFWEIHSDYWQRHSLKPGLTGLAQVRGFRGATETEGHLTDRLTADLEYIRNWSPMGDIRIMLATARVLIHPNAY
ncbi:exopolysaccharide biosynthesis polyprenyl glycosylphosphotransferase [Qipengyuania sp. RANM35]|uniref:exopolysaccharide biosynthesis polyprenyl glycosylphosphotransferase n=1 Tax=Qipengyuania sp. RANM35 TaxID=3068635 RepID=UPI0034DB4EF8